VTSEHKYLKQDGRVSDDLPFGSRGGLGVRHTFPVDGEYVAKIYLSRTYDGRVRGLANRHQLEVRLDGALIEVLTLGGPRLDNEGKPGRPDYRNAPDDGQEVRFTVGAGPHLLAVSFVDQASVLEGMRRPHYAVTSYEYAGDQTVDPGVGRVELRGPYNVTGRGDTPSRRTIFSCRPPVDAVASGSDEVACAREILGRLGRRAFRRPVTEADLEMLLGFFEMGRADGDFDTGIEMALRRVLVSPDFLFRRERDPDGVAVDAAYTISDLELASRLSFFLWSSLPDDALLNLAERGGLRLPGVLETQVEQSQIGVESAELALRNSQLISPIDGVVGIINIRTNEMPNPSLPAMVVADPEGFHIKLNVDELDIGQVKVGQTALITVDALNDAKLTGVVARIAPVANTTAIGGSSIVTYEVIINLDPTDLPLRSGMTATVSIITDKAEDVIVIPNRVMHLDETTKQPYVEKLVNDVPTRVDIVLGLRNEQYSEVVDGLQEGDVLVIRRIDTGDILRKQIFGGG